MSNHNRDNGFRIKEVCMIRLLLTNYSHYLPYLITIIVLISQMVLLNKTLYIYGEYTVVSRSFIPLLCWIWCCQSLTAHCFCNDWQRSSLYKRRLLIILQKQPGMGRSGKNVPRNLTFHSSSHTIVCVPSQGL